MESGFSPTAIGSFGWPEPQSRNRSTRMSAGWSSVASTVTCSCPGGVVDGAVTVLQFENSPVSMPVVAFVAVKVILSPSASELSV